MFSMIPYRKVSFRTPSLFDDRLFRNFFDLGETLASAGFRVDLRDKGDAYLLEAELPGLSQDAIELTVDADVLTITANRNTEKKEEKENYVYCERRNGRIQRSFNLEGIDQENIKASYQHGVLTVILPKAAPEPPKAGRRIEIQ